MPNGSLITAHFPIVMSKGATSTLASFCCIVSYGGKHIVGREIMLSI